GDGIPTFLAPELVKAGDLSIRAPATAAAAARSATRARQAHAGCAGAAVPWPDVVRTLRGAPRRARMARAPGPLLDADARRPPDRLAAAAVAHLVGAVDRGRGPAAAVDPVRVQRRRVAHARRRLRDQRLRRPLAGPTRRAHPRAAAGHRRGARARGAGAVRGADAGGLRPGAHAQPADHPDERRR